MLGEPRDLSYWTEDPDERRRERTALFDYWLLSEIESEMEDAFNEWELEDT